jgi:hypothetical protein
MNKAEVNRPACLDTDMGGGAIGTSATTSHRPNSHWDRDEMTNDKEPGAYANDEQQRDWWAMKGLHM